MKINVKAFSLACGIVWGFGLFLFTWWVIANEGVTGEPTLIGRLYLGYTISIVGSFIGFAWAFVDGMIGGALFSGLYNMLSTSFMRTES